MKKYTALYLTLLVFSLVLTAFQVKTPERISLQNLRCEMLVNPEGIGTTRPRLSWEILAPARGVEQTAYQVLVASSPEKLATGEGDLWSSGKVNSNQSVHVTYAGKPLKSLTDCYWQVKIWTSHWCQHTEIVL